MDISMTVIGMEEECQCAMKILIIRCVMKDGLNKTQ